MLLLLFDLASAFGISFVNCSYYAVRLLQCSHHLGYLEELDLLPKPLLKFTFMATEIFIFFSKEINVDLGSD
jgi:hypothetical protein